MTDDSTLETITRQYLPAQFFGAVESKILAQNCGLAGPIIVTDELDKSFFSTSLIAASAAIGNLTHQLDLDRPVYWCVTRAKVVNAMISGYRSPDMYCVVIAEGALMTIMSFCIAIMCSEPLFQFLSGDVDPFDDHRPAERSRREAWAKIEFESDDRATHESIERAFPLAFIASHFLMAHEIAHLAGGHLPLYAGGFAAEAGGKGLPALAESRTLERDADALAAAATLYLLGTPDMASAWSDILKDQKAGLRYFLVTAYIFFSAMDLFGPEDPFAKERTHPPALVRVNIMTSLIAFQLQNFGHVSLDEAWDLARRSTRAVEIAVMELGGGMMTADEVGQLDGDVVKNVEEHAKVWSALEARLDRRHLEKYIWSRGLR